MRRLQESYGKPSLNPKPYKTLNPKPNLEPEAWHSSWVYLEAHSFEEVGSRGLGFSCRVGFRV